VSVMLMVKFAGYLVALYQSQGLFSVKRVITYDELKIMGKKMTVINLKAVFVKRS
jgi:hypothetical protein